MQDGNAQPCKTTCDDGSFIQLTKSKDYIKVNDGEEAMKNAIYTYGTIGTIIFTYTDFIMYDSGIYQHVHGEFIGAHSVVTVGYGEENGVKYWTLRNSWGTEWGENGFIRVLRGVNECNVEDESIVAIVK